MAPPSARNTRRQRESARDARAAKAARAGHALPAAIFALSVVATALSLSPLARSAALRRVFTALLSLSFVLSGAAHFHAPLFDFYASMVFLPAKAFWIYATGALMILAGAGLMVSDLRRAAADAVVAILVLVFPGNVACVFMERPRRIVFGGSMPMALMRLPLQLTYARWAYWVGHRV